MPPASLPSLTAIPSVNPPQKQARKPPTKKAKATSPISPDSVLQGYLQQEINIAKTKITSLEVQIQEKDDKIKTLEDYIKIY